MALNGTYIEKICNGYITLSVEWRVEQDILNSTNTYHYDVYIDTSACASAKYDDGRFLLYATGISSNTNTSKMFDFSFTRLDATGKTKVGSFSTKAISIGEEDETIQIRLVTFEMRAYTDLITYVDARLNRDYQYFTVDGIKRTTIGNIYGNCILGNEHSISVTRRRTEFTHRIDWACGTESGLICDNSTNETFDFTLSVDLSEQNTSGITVPVIFKITTYYNGHEIGVEEKTVAFTIPDYVIPSCTVKVTDATFKDGQALTDIYGGYVQRQSRFNIVVTPTLAYKSPIDSYCIKANGVEYNTAESTTGLIKNAGANEIIVTVTDKRGRTSETVVETVDVIPYVMPIVSSVKVNRCDADGVEQKSGNDHIKVTFNAEISAVNNINSASYMVTYQKVSGLSQVDVLLTDYAGQYSVSDGVYIFEADVNSPYEITVKATDDFATGSRATGGSSAMTILNILASGLGLCFGGVATLEGVLENMLLTYPSGGFMFPTLEAGADLINTRTSNVYTVENGQDVNHSPVEDGYTLIVLPGADTGDFVYIAITGHASVYINTLTNSSWGVWKQITMS